MASILRRRLILVGVGIGTFLVLVLLAGVGVGLAYRHKFFPNTKVGNISLAGQSQSAGAATVHEAVQGYLNRKVVVAVPNIQKPREANGDYPFIEVPTTAKQLGLTFTSDPAVAAAWSVGHTYTLTGIMTAIHDLFSTTTVALPYSVDTTQITTFTNTQLLPQVDAPQPAKIVITGGVVSVVPQLPGLEINQKTVTAQLKTALSAATDGDTLYIKPDTTISNPSITTDTLQPIVDQLDTLGNMKVTLSGGSTQLKPTRADILSWYTPVEDDAGNVTLQFQSTKLADYITKNTGSQVDQQKSTDAAIKALTPTATKAITSVAITLVAKVIAVPANVAAGSYTLGDYSGKYIEVNLAEQKLYRIDGSNLEKVYEVSSGKWSTPTPIGTFTINGHAKMAYTPLYGLYMPFWMNFKDGLYGIHELPVWPDGYQEGANHLGSPVSDGCIRLGVGDAEEMYNWTPDGTPVIIRAS